MDFFLLANSFPMYIFAVIIKISRFSGNCLFFSVVVVQFTSCFISGRITLF